MGLGSAAYHTDTISFICGVALRIGHPGIGNRVLCGGCRRGDCDVYSVVVNDKLLQHVAATVGGDTRGTVVIDLDVFEGIVLRRAAEVNSRTRETGDSNRFPGAAQHANVFVVADIDAGG